MVAPPDVVELPDGVLRRPDGDVELSDKFQKTFRVPPCPRCGGVLKPNVVFFGDGLPASRAARWPNLPTIYANAIRNLKL